MDLMVPAEVRTIAKMPVLGTGKIDFVAVKGMVLGGAPLTEVAAAAQSLGR